MNKIKKLAIIFGSTIFYLNTTHANTPTTFLGPNLKLDFASDITDRTGYSVLGEAGAKNLRLGGTVGWRIMENQRLKISAEYLWQNINYPFFSGNTDRVIHQGAMGATYQYDLLCYDYKPQLGVNAYGLHSVSDSLNTASGSFINNVGAIQTFTETRRIAGANAAGISPNLTVQPWLGGIVGLELNYDHLRYDKNNSPDEDAIGFGGTVRVAQEVAKDIIVGASAAVRSPFNNYTANVTWSNVPYFGRWTLGVDADYTAGKNTLPNTYDVSLNVNYAIDITCPTSAKSQAAIDNLIAWVTKPAVYIPEVLAVPDRSL